MKRILLALCVLFLALPAFAGEFAGRWAVTAKDPDGNVYKSEMEFKKTDSGLKAIFKMNDKSTEVNEIKETEDKVEFKLPYGDMMLTIRLKLVGAGLKGEFETENGDIGPIEGTRITE